MKAKVGAKVGAGWPRCPCCYNYVNSSHRVHGETFPGSPVNDPATHSGMHYDASGIPHPPQKKKP